MLNDEALVKAGEEVVNKIYEHMGIIENSINAKNAVLNGKLGLLDENNDVMAFDELTEENVKYIKDYICEIFDSRMYESRKFLEALAPTEIKYSEPEVKSKLDIIKDNADWIKEQLLSGKSYKDLADHFGYTVPYITGALRKINLTYSDLGLSSPDYEKAKASFKARMDAAKEKKQEEVKTVAPVETVPLNIANVKRFYTDTEASLQDVAPLFGVKKKELYTFIEKNKECQRIPR